MSTRYPQSFFLMAVGPMCKKAHSISQTFPNGETTVCKQMGTWTRLLQVTFPTLELRRSWQEISYGCGDWGLRFTNTTLNIIFSVNNGILCHYDNFLDDNSYEQVNKYCHGWWMSPSIGPNPYLLSSTTCDEILTWMIEVWMKSLLISDSNCITVNL